MKRNSLALGMIDQMQKIDDMCVKEARSRAKIRREKRLWFFRLHRKSGGLAILAKRRALKLRMSR